MRIALVHRDLHTPARGGINTVYHELATRLRDAGHELTLITQQSPTPIELAGVEVLALPRTDDMTAHRTAVDQVLTALEPDLVESSTWEAETLHYVQRPASERAPVVVRGDLSAATMQTRSELVAAERALVHAAEQVLAVSAFAADDLAAAYSIPAPPVVSNGVDRDQFGPGPIVAPSSGYRLTLGADGTILTRDPVGDSPVLPPPWSVPAGRSRLLWIGKTTPMKGWDRLEQLATELADCAHITVLLGHAPVLSPITLSGAEEYITILQDLALQDLVHCYRSTDFLLSTSRWEGFGLAIGEALACGTPALLPEELGTADELLAAGGGATYRTACDLRRQITRQPRTQGVLPEYCDWDRNVAATLQYYRALHRRSGQRVGR